MCIAFLVLKTATTIRHTYTCPGKGYAMDFNVAKIACSERIVTKSSTISLRVACP